MKIEVTIEGREPYTWPMGKDRIVVGSGDDSDLVLKIKGISKKHVLIVLEDEKYLVVDQGSAGGTFINDEQLVPGQRTEFNSFFPVRLGPHVMLSLLSDDEEEGKSFEFGKALAPPPEKAQAQATAAPKVAAKVSGTARPAVDVSIGARASGIQGRDGVGTRSSSKRKAVTAAAPPADADATRMKRVKALALVIAIGGAGVFFYLRPKAEDPQAVAQELPAEAVEQAPKPSLTLEQLTFSIPAPALRTAEELLAIPVCANPIDFEACKTLALPEGSGGGKAGLFHTPEVLALLVPRLTGGDMWARLSVRLGLPEETKQLFPESLESRDLITLFLLSFTDEDLAKIGTQRWLVAAVLDDFGGVGGIYFANLPALRSVYANTSSEIASGFRTMNFPMLEQLSGQFRRLGP